VYRGAVENGHLPVYLVVDGRLRVYIHSSNGREITVRYAEEGDVLGLPTLVAAQHNPDLCIQAMTDAQVLALPGEQLVYLATKDVAVAWPLARYLANLVHGSEEMWSANMFQLIRSRVARHLLNLAVRESNGLVARVTHEELASAVGSIREVISRTLKELDDENLIDRRPGSIHLCDPAALHRVASAPPAS
jgi:CRP-like cAMP-binding protein